VSPATDTRLNEIEKHAILVRIDHMIKVDKDGKHVRDKDDMLVFDPNVKELARQIASEKHVNPTPDEIATVERHIRRLNKIRKDNPFWPQRRG
jgi:hypothetical protein